MEMRYGRCSVDSLEPGDLGCDFTAALGCTATRVVAYRLRSDDVMPLETEREALVVPVTDGNLQVRDVGTLSRGSIGFVPAGRSIALTAATAVSVLVVSAASGDNTPGGAVLIDLANCEFEIPETSDVATAWLSGRLGCAAMKVNVRSLEPGQRVPYHTEGDQEELFIPIRGQTEMVIGGELLNTPIGSVTRVAPPVARSAINDGSEDALWVMIGAPPTGAHDAWDPGARIVELPDAVDQSASDSTPR